MYNTNLKTLALESSAVQKSPPTPRSQVQTFGQFLLPQWNARDNTLNTLQSSTAFVQETFVLWGSTAQKATSHTRLQTKTTRTLATSHVLCTRHTTVCRARQWGTTALHTYAVYLRWGRYREPSKRTISRSSISRNSAAIVPWASRSTPSSNTRCPRRTPSSSGVLCHTYASHIHTRSHSRTMSHPRIMVVYSANSSILVAVVPYGGNRYNRT